MSKKQKPAFRPGDYYDESIARLKVTERRDVLEGIAYKVASESYTKSLTPEEQAEKKSELAEISIQISELEAEKKILMAEMKARLEEPLKEKDELLGVIKHKSERREGLLYYIDDQDAGMMYIFDDNAECIEARALRPDEKQMKIKSLILESNG